METPTSASPPDEAKPKKRSSVRHTGAIQRDRSKRPTSAPPTEAVVARLTEIVHPATLAQVSYFHGLGLHARLLTLPVMVALVLRSCEKNQGSIWIPVSSVDQATSSSNRGLKQAFASDARVVHEREEAQVQR